MERVQDQAVHPDAALGREREPAMTHVAGPGICAEFPRVPPPDRYDESMLAFLRTTKFYDQGRPLNAHQVLSHHPPAGRSLNRFLDWGDDAVLSARERR